MISESGVASCLPVAGLRLTVKMDSRQEMAGWKPAPLQTTLQVFAEVFAGVVHESLVGLIHNGIHRAADGIHGQNAQGLVSALVEQEREAR